MLFNTNKEKGNAGLAAAIGYYGMNGYIVSIPMNDTQDYDLIVDNGKKLLKIQVKATGQRSDLGYSIVSLRSTGGTKGIVYKTVIETNIDILFVLTEKMEMYEIPIEEIITKSTLTLTPERQKFRVDSLEIFYEKKVYEQKTYEELICKECGNPISKRSKSGLCQICSNKSRIRMDRPTGIDLAKIIIKIGFEAVGRDYGVSGNAVKKWCKTDGVPYLKTELKEWYEKQIGSE